MGEGGKEVERRLVLRGGHLGAVFPHEAVPFARALRALRELDQPGAGGERRQPDVVEVLGRILALLHAAGRPPHRADAKTLVRESIGAELNDAGGHCGDQLAILTLKGPDRNRVRLESLSVRAPLLRALARGVGPLQPRTALALKQAAMAEDARLPMPTTSHT